MMRPMALAGGRRQLFLQVVRFGINGLLVTMLQAAVYTGTQRITRMPPLTCYFIGYVTAVLVGYVLHSQITFRGHGQRGWRSFAKFVIGSLPSYFVNLFWTWLLTVHLHLAWWTPLVPLFLVTPIMIFVLNRWWVFK